MRVVASLTTIPNRINKLEPILNALYNQTIKFDNIYLNIPLLFKEQKYIIPKFVENYDNLKIIRCEKDYGPITKLIPVLDVEKEPDTIIITFDDDSIPNKNVLKIFLNKAKKYPNCALSFSGWCIGKFPFYFEFIGDNIFDDIDVDWVQGTHGILYRRSFINKKEILDYPEDKRFFKNDDHWISYYLKKNNIKKKSIGFPYKEYFKNNNDICKVDAISGNYSLLFFKEVMELSLYLKNINIYNISNNMFSSIIFKISIPIISFIFLIILIKFK